MKPRIRSVAALASALLAVTGLTVGVGAATASASTPCSHVAVSDKSTGVVQTPPGGAVAHTEPAGECPAVSLAGGLRLNAWCYTYNYYGNYWVNVNGDRWIYAADYLVLVSGTVKHC